MLADLWRWRRRAWLVQLASGELPAEEATRRRALVESDPRLATELRRLETILGSLGQGPDEIPPASFRTALEVDLDILDEPLRERYSELLDGSLEEAAAAALRQAIAARPELARELRRVESAVAVLRCLPEAPLPAGFRSELARRLEAEPGWAPRRAPLVRPTWALAAATLLLALGLGGRALRQPALSPASPATVAEAPRPSVTPPVEVGPVTDNAPVAVEVAPAPVGEAPVIRVAGAPRPRRAGAASAPAPAAPLRPARAVDRPAPAETSPAPAETPETRLAHAPELTASRAATGLGGAGSETPIDDSWLDRNALIPALPGGRAVSEVPGAVVEAPGRGASGSIIPDTHRGAASYELPDPDVLNRIETADIDLTFTAAETRLETPPAPAPEAGRTAP